MTADDPIVTWTFAADEAGRVVATVTLAYDPAEPFAVTVVFFDRGGTAEWVFDRSLLVDGLAARAGLMDVVVEPAGDRLSLTLTGERDGSRNEVATVFVTRSVVEYFLRRTHRPARHACANVDLDAALAKLLDGAR